MTDEDHDISNSSVLAVTRRIETRTQYRNDEPGPSDRVLPNKILTTTPNTRIVPPMKPQMGTISLEVTVGHLLHLPL